MAKKPKKDEAEAAPAEGGDDAAKAKKKKMIIIGAAAAVLVLGGGGGAAFFLMGGKKDAAAAHGGAGGHGAPAAPEKKSVFVDLPEMTINLSAVDQRAAYLKVKIALEVTDAEAVPKIQPILPRVLDAFQVYLRELRTSDLDGSAGLYRVKEELQKRVNIAIYPARVDAVLFKEILVQ